MSATDNISRITGSDRSDPAFPHKSGTVFPIFEKKSEKFPAILEKSGDVFQYSGKIFRKKSGDLLRNSSIA